MPQGIWLAVLAALSWGDRAGPDRVRAALAGRRPNIVLIVSDDQGYGDLGRHGNRVIATPNLDRLYDRGARFTDFHVSPTCSPTRCALLTGRHEFRSGVTHTFLERERMAPRALTIAEVLESAGYATGIFGKWHLGDEPRYRPGRRGFGEVFIHGAGGIGQTFPGSCGDAPGNSYFNPVLWDNGRFRQSHGYCTDVFFERARRWMRSKAGRRPFFALIAPNAPHEPLDVPWEYAAMYRDRLQGVPAERRERLARFLGMVTNLDANVGRLVGDLHDWGIARETLVIFMNDNGGTVGTFLWNGRMRGAKGSAFNGGTRAMSLWYWPGTIEAGDRGGLTAHLDVFPTLSELAGARLGPKWRARLEGCSLLPLLADNRAGWPKDRMLFTHLGRWPAGADPSRYAYAGCSVRWRNYNLVSRQGSGEEGAGGGRWMLFDLDRDPRERRDLARNEPRIVARLGASYEDWWEGIEGGLVNEHAYHEAPAMNPFKAEYWRQYGGPGPNGAPLPW